MVWVVSLSTLELISQSLTPELLCNGIQSLIGVGSLVRPLAHSVLYLHYKTSEAVPKYISKRTSYFQV